MKKRILSILTVLALCLGLLPSAAFALDGDKAIMLGTNGISGYDSTNGYDYIYFGNWEALDIYTTSGPIKWRVLDDQTNTEEPGLFLLSDGLFGKGKYGGGVCFDSSSPYSNVWQGSDAQKWCQNFYSSSFSTGEQGAVFATTKTDAEYDASSGAPPLQYGVSQLEGDTVFFLSAEEAENKAYGFIDDDARKAYFGNTQYYGAWWLRSPLEQQRKDGAGSIHRNYGYLYGMTVSKNDYTARPAFNLDLDDVLFTSAADGGKSATGMESGLTAVDAYDGSEWKLTLKDSSRNFDVTETDISGDPGDTITLHYTGATTGDNEYISVILAAESSVQYYGRIARATTADAAEGEISLTIPETLAEGTYTLNVFNEQCNGDYKTDYASAFEAVTLTVDTTAPKLSNGSATRDGENEAMVKFTSDEAGSYYYVVDNNATAPDSIDTTTTAGTSCKANEETEISIDSLSNGVQYIHIVVKDAVNNVSDILTIQIPAYTYTLTVNLNGGSGSATGGQYPAGEVVNIDAGSRSSYRFTGWTTSNGGSFADASSASTTFTMPAENVTITANWQYDSPYIPPTKPDGPSTGTSDGWEDIREEIADADKGDTITIDMNGETEVPAEIFEEVAGKDVTVEFELEDGISWAVNGQDIPTATDFSDLDLGVDLGTKGISVDVINTVTGELGSVQITLAHDGQFGFTLTLTAPLGKENAGYWANLYHYGEVGETLDFETSAQVASDGTASLRMTHASQYAIVIDDKSHALPFTDLGENQWYESAVRYAFTHDIMEGMSETKFSPNTSLTRAEAVQVLYNLEGQPAVSDSTTFPDLVEEWYKPAIAWAEQTGVVDGYEDGTFRPGQPVNRMEFAQMLYNYAQYKGYDLTAQGDLTAFPDGDSVQPWAETAMTWANGNQLINGHDDGTLEPGGTTTRAQAASILMRFDQNVVEN